MTAFAVHIQGAEDGIGDIEQRAVVIVEGERIEVLGGDFAELLADKARRLPTDDRLYRCFRPDGVHRTEARIAAMGLPHYDMHRQVRRAARLANPRCLNAPMRWELRSHRY